jgi:hypothetical protein
MYPARDKTGRCNWRISCTLNKSFDFLLKSNIDYNISSLSKEEFFHRLTGVIDAEGSIILRKGNGKYIARGIFIGSENKKMITEIAKKLKELGCKPYVYKMKEKGDKSKIGTLTIKYNNNLWALMILRKEDLNKLIDKISLRHEEKRELKLLLKKSLKMRLWSEIKDKVKKLKDRFKKEVAISKQKALLSLRKSAQNFEKSPPVE